MGFGSSDIGLIFKISADSADAQKDLKKFKKDLDEIEKAAKDVGTPMQQLGQRAGLTAGQYEHLAGNVSMAGNFLRAFSGIAVAEIALLAGLGAGLFSLANSASEFGSEIKDASDKTGLSAETLSALKVAAEQSGSSLEAVTKGFAKFAKQVEDDGGDVEEALASVLKEIAAYPPGLEQMRVAQEKFGKSGADLLPFIASFNGDLPALIAKCKELGLTMSDENAKAADEFGDTLDTLKSQVAATGRAMAFEFMPAITHAMELISESLIDNQSTVRVWGSLIGDTIDGVTVIWEKGVGAMNAVLDLFGVKMEKSSYAAGFWGRAILFSLAPPLAFLQLIGEKLGDVTPDVDARVQALIDKVEKFKTRTALQNDPASQQSNFETGSREANEQAAAVEEEAAKLRKEAAEKRRKEREAEFQKELAAQSKQTALLLASQRTEFASANADWEKAFLAGEATKEQFRKKALANIEQYGRSVQALLDRQRDQELQGKVGTERDNVMTQYQQASVALGRELIKERDDVETTITGIVKKENDERVKSNKEANAETLADAKSVTERLISDFDVMFAKKLITERQYNEAVGLLKLKQLELERALTDDARERFRIDQEIKALKNELAIQGIELAEKEVEAANAVTEAIRQQNLEWENLFAMVANEEASPFQTIIAGWNAVAEAMAESAPGMTDVIDLMANAFSGMANAIGNVVQQYVMYGKTAPGIMRQVLAQALAAIAAEAAMRAVYALAMGFFFLATHQYVDATNAFISAAIFGSIAVGAALLGRAIAPKQQAQTAFNSQASTATTSQNPGQGSAGKAGVYSSQEDITVDRGRNTPGRFAVELMVRSKDAFADMFAFEISKNGRLRSAIQEAAAA